jgi:hypothetical protein
VAEQGIINRLRSDLDAWWNDRRPVTTGHQETARETGVMLGLMADANAAGPEMTDEQRILLINAAPGMRAREAVLLNIPNRSTVEENELHMIRREMAKLEGREQAAPATPQVRGFLGPLAPAGVALGAVRPWMLWTGAIAAVGVWGAYNDVRAGRLENDRNEARATVESLEREVMEASAVRDSLADAVREADELSRATAANLEAERARSARARAIEQRRTRELRQVDAGGPPPAWERSLRDAGDPETGPDHSGGAAPGHSE